jgi:hypothetical protein
MKEQVPLCFTRIWCRQNDAWLSFKTNTQDRFLVNPEGYFIELPDGSLTRISPRTTFPIIDRFPTIVLDTLVPRKQFGEDAFFISVPLRSQSRQEPNKVTIDEIYQDPLENLNLSTPLVGLERYVLLRLIENGTVALTDLQHILDERNETGKSIGEIVINQGTCHWESLLGHCLDIRPPSRLDPPNLRTIIERREWELTGEVLFALDCINRTELEHALKIKRDGQQALGQILTAMGACRTEDIAHCLNVQEQMKYADHEGIVLIGKLLVSQNIISDTDLEEILWKQRVARQPLGRILVSMGACSQREIDQYETVHGGGFQQSIDEATMGQYLVKTDTITKIQLEEALRIQHRGRQVLGEMLVTLGMCGETDIQKVVVLQKEVREAFKSGVQRLGDLLISSGRVPGHIVDEALRTQSIGRQPFGSILVALKACSGDDVNLALDVQHKWRARPKDPGDRLGEVLVRHKILTEAQLEGPLLRHMREQTPLGRILVEEGICDPESIVGALIDRDQARQEQFFAYVRSHLPSHEPAPSDDDDMTVAAGTPGPLPEKLIQRISGIFRKDRQGSA